MRGYSFLPCEQIMGIILLWNYYFVILDQISSKEALGISESCAYDINIFALKSPRRLTFIVMLEVSPSLRNPLPGMIENSPVFVILI